MHRLRPTLRHWLSARSLRTQLLMITVGLSLAGLLIVMPLSLQRQQRQTETESREWAGALAILAAHASSVPLAENDFATLDGALQ